MLAFSVIDFVAFLSCLKQLEIGRTQKLKNSSLLFFSYFVC